MTVQVDFYVLEGQARPADKDAYACRIAATAHGRGLTVYMQTDDAAHAQALDKKLWTFSQGSFVPHALCEAGDHDPQRYPVQIGCGEAPDGCADVLISLRREAPADYARFARVAELILDDQAERAAGRERFRFYRERGIEPNTHKTHEAA